MSLLGGRFPVLTYFNTCNVLKCRSYICTGRKCYRNCKKKIKKKTKKKIMIGPQFTKINDNSQIK